MENFNLVGKNLNNKKVYKESQSKLTDQIFEKLRPVEGELEKTEQEKKMIMMVDILLEEVFEELDLEYDHFIDENQVHVIPENKHSEYIGKGAEASYHSDDQQIYLERALFKKLAGDHFHSLLHESVHAVSHHKYFVHEHGQVDNYRLGYRTAHPTKDLEHFRAFNEAVTERITLEIINKKENELSEELSIPKESFGDAYMSYSEEVDVLETMIDTISEKTEKPFNEIWSRIKKSLFTGEMMHLREVEEVFGKDGLKVLASMKTHYQKEESKVLELYKLYFSNKLSDTERSLITKRILSESKNYE